MSLSKMMATLLASVCLSAPVVAQNLSVDDINSMIDEKMENLSPYQEILNHPDPDRALAGMKIMLEEGDETLRRMALEYGLLSPSTQVRQAALEAYLQTGPILALSLDGSQVKDSSFERTVRGYHSGTVDDNKMGYWKLPVSRYHDEMKCFPLETDNSTCAITINENGIFLTPRALNGRATFNDDGKLEGTAALNNINNESVPFTVNLIN